MHSVSGGHSLVLTLEKLNAKSNAKTKKRVGMLLDGRQGHMGDRSEGPISGKRAGGRLLGSMACELVLEKKHNSVFQRGRQ